MPIAQIAGGGRYAAPPERTGSGALAAGSVAETMRQALMTPMRSNVGGHFVACNYLHAFETRTRVTEGLVPPEPWSPWPERRGRYSPAPGTAQAAGAVGQ
jgi:hypothetical protein